MQKREKQLLGVMAVVLMVGAYMYVSTPGEPAPGAVAPGAVAPGRGTVAVDEVAKNIDQARLTPEQAYRLALLTDNATGNPFYGGQGGIPMEDDPSLSSGQDVVYSGFMKVGYKLFAVLNGVEYAVGDELAEGGYRVQGIDKNFVILERTDGSTGRKLTRRVPLVEDDTDKIRIRVVKKR